MFNTLLVGCLSVCIVKTAEPKILCGTAHAPGKGLRMLKITKICVRKFLIFCKILKLSGKDIMKSANFILLLFYSVHRKDAHI